MDIYLDESGNFAGGDGQYFIVSSYTVGDPRRIAKAFRKWQKNKLPNKLKGQPEIKFNDPHIHTDLKLKTIDYLAGQDVRISYTYLRIKNIPEEYRKGGRVYETGLLYTKIVIATLELYLPLTQPKFIVTRDKRSLKGVSIAQFNESVKIGLLPKLPSRTSLYVNALDSSSNANIQVADWICGALAQYHEHKPGGEALYTMLKRNIIQGQELFSDYWTKKWEQ